MRKHRPQSLLQRLIEPAEIANLVVYLSSVQASATTGGAVRVDGGYVDRSSRRSERQLRKSHAV
jgi:NAD(P)-dependent dehydrogenase (short-subunit alcohol dehydrogenase family)